MFTEAQRKRAFTAIIVTQCLGMVSNALFQNGFYLNYFTKLGISSSMIALLFSLPPLVGTFIILPFAFMSDRMGKKRLALSGQVLLILGIGGMMMAGRGDPAWALPLVLGSLFLLCIGGSLQGANWFALLSPIVPREIRGRFFGRLRVTFTTVCILFTLMATRVLETNQTMAAFQVLLLLVLVAHILRFFTYARIPELENANGESGQRRTFRGALTAVFSFPGIVSFNCYMFLIALFTAGIAIVFGLMQKDVFGFSPAQITLMGTFFLAGGIGGNLVAGRLVDRCGTRVVFLLSHISYALVIGAMLSRHWVPWSLPMHVGVCAFLYSMVVAINGVAGTSELLALIPAVNKSLATAVHLAFFFLGTALSGMFVSQTINWHILAPEWKLLGRDFTVYDTLLIVFATMILLMLAAIGLVPKIVKEVQLLPGNSYPRI